MNKNKENYKKALDQIYPSEELKENTFKKASLKPKVKKPVFMKYLAACAVFALCFSLGALRKNNSTNWKWSTKIWKYGRIKKCNRRKPNGIL